MTPQPKVSVLVPAYNGEKYLAECLDSILMQDFPDYELLISDDGSTDGTAAMIELYAAKEPRIRWWRNPVNLGQAANLNLCLREARGEFIKFVFADDKLIAASAVRQMVQALEADPAIAIVGSASHVINARGRVIQVRDYFRDGERKTGDELLRQCLEQPLNLIGEPSVAMFRRKSAGRGFDRQFRQLLDLEFWFYLLEKGDFAYIAEPLGAFRRHQSQQTELNRRDGTSAREEIQLKKIYYPKILERGLATRLMLFNQIRQLQKFPDDSALELKTKLMQKLGNGWHIFYALRYRLWRLFQDLKFWRNRQTTNEESSMPLYSPPNMPARGDQPQVSVLIPVFNGQKYLAECLDSVLGQNFEEMEILIADDGSTDGSRELIQSYAEKDRRIRWWRNPANLGLARNFNCCLHAARGNYVKYILQDDLLLSPDALRLMAEQLDNDGSVALVGSASHLLDAASRTKEIRKYFSAGTMPGKDVIRSCLEQPSNKIGEPSVVMFRRALAGRGFNERFKQLVDLEMWIHLLAQGRFAYVSRPLCAFRQHAAQQTAVNRRQIPPGTEELMLWQEFSGQPWSRPMITRRFLFATVFSLQRHHNPDSRDYVAQMRRDLGSAWYYFFWVHRKLTRPFMKLGRWIARRSGRLGKPKLAS